MSYEEEIQSTLEEQAKLEEKSRKLIDQFYINHEQADVFSIIDIIINMGNPKNIEFLKKFKEKFCNGELTLPDIARYNDLYEMHKPILLNWREKDV